MKKAAASPAPVAPELAAHGYVITKPVPGSAIPADYTFVLTRDEIYVPIAVRRPQRAGRFPVVVMGRGAGRGGLPHVEEQVARLAAMQDRIIERGYAVAYVNYRNEVPYLYSRTPRAANLGDDMSGGENRTLKSSATLDSDDLVAILSYLRALPYGNGRVGVMGVSHGGEMILKVAAEMTFEAGVVIEGASHEFLAVDTGPGAPRIDNELQYQDIDVVRRNADKAKAMERIRRIATPTLHLGRDRDHLQGIFQLAHEWLREAGRDTQWKSFDHPDHGYPLIYTQADGSYRPDPIQAEAFEIVMDYFDARLK